MTRQSAITFEPVGLMGSPGHWRVGHRMGNLFPVHLGGKTRLKGQKTRMFVKSVRFCKVWPSLGCGLLTVKYGIYAHEYHTKFV